MAVVAKPATKSVDSSANVDQRPEDWQICVFGGFCVKINRNLIALRIVK